MRYKVYSSLLIVVALLGFQFASISSASASGNNNMTVIADWLYGDGTAHFEICNNGSTTIKQATVSFGTTNYEFDVVHVFTLQVNGNLGSDPGVFNESTGTWNGLVEPTKCIGLMAFGHPTGNLGDTMTVTINLLSTTEVDDSVENYSGVSATTPGYTNVLPADIASSARLLTTGVVNPGDTIEYQIDLVNNGPGTLDTTGLFLYALVLPEGTTLDNIVDLDPSDNVNVDFSSCFQMGTAGVLEIPGMEAYYSRTLILCMLTTNDGTMSPGNTTYPFKVELTAGASLAAGDSDIIGLFEGQDRGTAEIVRSGLDGSNIFTHNINNIAYLQYDPTELKATVGLCPGQNETSADSNGCFRITFNKDIYAPSFTQDNLVLSGGSPAISSFVQLDKRTWEIHVSGVTPGTILSLKLKDTNTIQDYSAVMNTVQVLGANTIRFVSPTDNSNQPTVQQPTSNNGTTNTNTTKSKTIQGSLASTGISQQGLPTALALLMIGFAIQLATSKKLRQLISTRY